MPLMRKNVVIGDRQYSIHTDGEYGKHLAERFEPATSALIAALCEPTSSVLDVGANIGITALLFGARAHAGAVHAVEPVPSAYALLQENVSAANANNVHLYNFALGANPGSVLMQGHRENLSGSFVADRHSIEDDGHFTTEVPLHRLDDVIASMNLDRLDLIKMDIEGYELDALEGAKRTLETHKPIVMLEMNYVALNLWRRMSLPDFRDRLLSIFPHVYAVQDGQWLDFTDTKQSHQIQFNHLTTWAFMDIVAGYDDALLRERLQRMGGMREHFDRSSMEFETPPVLRQRIAEQERQISHLNAELEKAIVRAESEAASQKNEQREDAAKLRTELNAAQQQAAALQASTSWRVTAPLRAVKRLFMSN